MRGKIGPIAQDHKFLDVDNNNEDPPYCDLGLYCSDWRSCNK